MSDNEPASADEAQTQRQRRYTRILTGVVAFLAVAVLVVLGVLGWRVVDRAQASAGCTIAELRIIADPSVKDAVQAVVDDMSEGRCADVTVRAEKSAVTARVLATGSEPEFDVWIPDSGMWAQQATDIAERHGIEMTELAVGESVASTPIVFAAPEATAKTLEVQNTGFADLASGTVAAILPDPKAVSASATALLALQTATGGDARNFATSALRLSETMAPDTENALSTVAAGSDPVVAVTTEQATLRAEATASPLVPIYPADLPFALSVPLITSAEATEEANAATETLRKAITDAEDVLGKHGFRGADGDAAGLPETVKRDIDIDVVEAVDQVEVQYTWQVLTAPSRMLSLNDVSGSMIEQATPELRRIDLFEQAAIDAIEALPSDSTVANWVFSSRRIGGQDWQEVLPFGSLGDPAHKQRTIETIEGFDALVGGGTGLYDSVLAAVKHMRETYSPSEVNLVLLNTDGYNEADDGLTLDELLAELKALEDPANPIPVIAVGYGPDTDMDALQKIAEATSGTAYQAMQPTDINTVLIDAMTQRGCRPNCA